MWLWQTGAVLLLLGLALLPAVPALAHGEAVMTVSPAVVAPGATINVEGEGVEAGEEFTISLQGVGFETTLGTVTVATTRTSTRNLPSQSMRRPAPTRWSRSAARARRSRPS